jgi:CRISPR-associated endonuclease Csn1
MVFDDKEDIPRNPVVLRSLNQARKVLNALVHHYGSPSAVHIEMARDLSRPMDERNKIKKAQEEFRDRNEKAKADFQTEFNMLAKSREFEKFLLYREQHGKCAYSLKPLDLDSVLHDRGYAEVDHVLPYSRSYDDSKNNKVLVLASENRDKGNRTPYEYLTSFEGGESGDRWRNFAAYVEGNKLYRLAKRSRLLRKHFGEEESREFRERNLNDTRYVCKFFKSYVERHLQLAEGSGSKRCVVLSGQLTAFLRARWGLNKVRGDNDRHHALDAAVVAACSHALVKRLSDYSKRKELEQAGNVIDAETGEIRDLALLAKLERHFPKPWEYFREELLLRLNANEPALLKSEAQRYGYPQEVLESLRPLFVSRAPQRRNSGAAHMDTIYAKPRLAHKLMVEAKTKQGKLRRTATPQELESMVIERIGVFDTTGQGAKKKYRFTVDRLEDIVDFERNEKMVHALRLWLAERGEDPKRPGTKIFPRKPQKSDPENGPFTGPEIKAIKMNGGAMSGFDVRGGLAQNERLIRLDVFQKNERYFLVPLYVRHRVEKELPIHTADGSIAVDENYEFLFSIFQNDLIEVKGGDGSTIQGYFRSYGGPPNPSNITLALHDRNSTGHPRANTNGEIPSIGVRTAKSLRKFHVDTLGNIYPAPPEERHGLA